MLKAAFWSEFNRKCLQRDVPFCIVMSTISVFISLHLNINDKLTLLTVIHFTFMLRKRKSNPAIGLAWGYYFGYLKKVLPKLPEKVNESKYRDFTISKLLVLIPADCYIYQELHKADKRLQFCENIEPANETVAGTRSRRYTNSCYRLDIDGERLYAIIEYASTLNTLLEMSKHKEAGLSEEERDRQVVIFYETIRNIICTYEDNPDIKRNVLFIFLHKGANVFDEIAKTLREQTACNYEL